MKNISVYANYERTISEEISSENISVMSIQDVNENIVQIETFLPEENSSENIFAHSNVYDLFSEEISFENISVISIQNLHENIVQIQAFFQKISENISVDIFVYVCCSNFRRNFL